jgi:hypothetical protein
MSNDDIQILPFYLVADVSYSMNEDAKIDTLNTLLPQLRDELVRAEMIPLLIRSIVNSSLAVAEGGPDTGAAAQAMASTLANADGFDVELD